MKLLIRQVKSLSEDPTIHFYCNPHSPLSLLTKVIQYYSYPVLSSLWIYPTLSCPRTFAPAISSPLCLASFFSSYRSQVEFHILQEASSDYPSLCRSPLVTLHLSSCFFRVAVIVFTNLFICWFWFWFLLASCHWEVRSRRAGTLISVLFTTVWTSDCPVPG